MATPTIDLNLSAEDIGVGLTLKTKDGKTITLDTFSVKDAEPEVARVRLDDVKIGDKLKLRGGRVLTVQELHYERNDRNACYAVDDCLRLHYLKDGRSNLYSKEDDVIEIIRAPVSLEDMKIGQKARMRRGDVVTLESRMLGACWRYWFIKDDGGVFTCTANGSYYSRDVLDERDIVEILPYKAPRISIKDAKKGDTFVLRNGEKWIHTGETSSVGHRGSQGGPARLWLLFSGHCPATDDGHDVVELIPAPKPTLADRISAALERNDAKIDRIVVSEDDWKALRDQNPWTSINYLHGIRLKYIDTMKKGEFSLVFTAD